MTSNRPSSVDLSYACNIRGYEDFDSDDDSTQETDDIYYDCGNYLYRECR